MYKTKILFSLVLGLLISATVFAQFNFNKVAEVNEPMGVWTDNDNALWIVRPSDGDFFKLENGNLIDKSAEVDFKMKEYMSCEGENNTILISGYGGIVEYDFVEGNASYLNTTEVINELGVWDVTIKNGEKWLALEYTGAAKYEDGNLTTYLAAENNMGGNWFTAIALADNGEVWLAGNSFELGYGIVNRFQNNSWETYGPDEGIDIEFIFTIKEDSQHNIWVGGTGLEKFDGTDWEEIPIGLSGGVENPESIYAIEEDAQGNMWFATRPEGGIFHYSNGQVSKVSTNKKFTGGVDGIHKSNEGKLYFCLQDGIYELSVEEPTLVQSITVQGKDGVSTIDKIPGTLQMEAIITPNDATNKTVTWSVDDENLATISATGVLSAKANGVVKVTATANDASGISGSADITIADATIYITAITVQGKDGKDEVLLDNTLQMEAIITPSNATTKDVTWEVGNTNIATIDANGLLTGKKNGLVSVTATATDGTGISGTTNIKVTTQVGIEEAKHFGLEILPNPTKDMVYINQSNAQYNISQISIFDLSGKLLLQSNQSAIQLKDIAQGIYFLKITLDNGKHIAVEKIVKQ